MSGVGATPGRIQGHGVIRDQDGNIKVEFIVDSEATPEQAKEFGLTIDESEEVNHGSNTPNSNT